MDWNSCKGSGQQQISKVLKTFFRLSTAYVFSGAGSSLSFYYWDLSVVWFKMFATILMWNFENFHVERIFFL